jgi:predicted component of type VI protein secretion system
MNDFNKLLQSLNPQEEQFNPRNYVEDPIQAQMPDSLMQKAKEEGMVEDSQPFPTPEMNNDPAPVIPTPEVPLPTPPSNPTPESPEQRLEGLMNALNAERKKEREDAESRKFKADIFKILGDSAGNIIGGAQAMNTKASVTPIKTQGYDVGDLVGQVDKRFDGDRKALMDQYKYLKSGEISEKDKAYLDMQEKQYQLGLRRANDSMDRFGQGEERRVKQFDENMKEKQELTPAQAKEIKDIDVSIDSLDKLESMKDFSTGPIAGRVEKVKRFIGASPANKAVLYSQLEMVTSQYGKAISGSAIADAEMERIKNQLPSENDPDDVFAARLLNFKDYLLDSRLRVLDSYQKSGRDVTPLKERKSIEELRANQAGINKEISPSLKSTVKVRRKSDGIVKEISADKASTMDSSKYEILK